MKAGRRTDAGPAHSTCHLAFTASAAKTSSSSGSSISDPRDTFSQGGYLAAKMTTEALLRLDPAKIDRASVSEALRAVTGFKSDLLCNTWYVGDGKRHNANHAGMIAVAHEGGWKPEGACVPTPLSRGP
jgi:hypothetical protein